MKDVANSNNTTSPLIAEKDVIFENDDKVKQN